MNLRQIEAWSKKYGWVKRVAAFDAEQDRIAQVERREQIADARDQARRAAKLAQRIALRPMVEIADSIQTVQRPPVELMRYLMDATKLEWIALGIPFEITRTEIDAPTPDDLENEEKLETMRRARGAFRQSRGGRG